MSKLNVVGIDPSSTKIGVAVFIDGKFQWADTFETDKKKSLEKNLSNYLQWLISVYDLIPEKIDVTVVESAHSSIRNVQTIKKIAYYESISLLAASDTGTKAIQIAATSARKNAFGNGHLKKDEIDMLVRKLEPGYEFKSKDETDAYCLALAVLNM